MCHRSGHICNPPNHGGIGCILRTTNDVTERVRSELALKESERRYRALSSAGQMVYRMKADWTERRELDGRGFLPAAGRIRAAGRARTCPARTAARLRADPATAGALLVAVTGYGQDSDRQQILAAGFDRHLVKPVDLERLEAILATVA